MKANMKSTKEKANIYTRVYLIKDNIIYLLIDTD